MVLPSDTLHEKENRGTQENERNKRRNEGGGEDGKELQNEVKREK